MIYQEDLLHPLLYDKQVITQRPPAPSSSVVAPFAAQQMFWSR